MKKSLFYYLFVVLCAVNLFSSCSDEETVPGGSGEETPIDLQTPIVGTYDGTLSVSLNGVNITPDPLAQRIFVKQDGTDKVEMSLRDFTIQIGGSPLSVGDIIVKGIALDGEPSNVELVETKVTQQHELLGSLDITITGTVADENAKLNIGVIQHMDNGNDMNIAVTFEGTRVSKEVDDTDYSKTVEGFYPLEGGSFTSDYQAEGFELKWPNGVELVAVGYNKVQLKSTYISFPTLVEKGNATQPIEAETIKMQKSEDGSLIFEEVKGHNDEDEKAGREAVDYTISGSLNEKVLTLNVTMKSANFTINYKYVSGNLQKTGNDLLGMTFDSDVVVVQPEISDKTVTFYVMPGTTAEQLKLVPVFEVSEGAKVMYNNEEYVAGTAIDFSSTVTLKVQSEKGVAKSYTVSSAEMKEYSFASNLDTWEMKNADGEEYTHYYEPVDGWATSNEGLKWVKMMYPNLYSKEAPYLVTEVEDAHSGHAARLETVDTKGQAGFGGFIPAVPKVTSGSLFNGIFSVNISNTLKSTQFGQPCTKEPKSFSGFYKYTPGKTYYEAKYPGDPSKANEVNEVDKTDAPAINAVLYEVTNFSTDYLDGTNLLTSDKIVAIASVADAGTQAQYTSFNVAFEWKNGKSWDASKKYKLAIVCSSSKDGDKFSGAPGSVLFVDELSISF